MSDEFDRRPEQRLRAYESRIPDELPPDPGTLRPRRRPGWLVALAGAATVAAAAVLAVVVINAQQPDVGQASPTAEPTATPTATAKPSATAERTATPSPTTEPTPTPALTGIQWEEHPWQEQAAPRVVTFDEVTGTWVAFSHSSVWTSEDGSAWVSGRVSVPECRFPDCTHGVRDITSMGGTLIAVGLQTVGGDSNLLATWTSEDGAAWEPLGLSSDFVAQVAAAASGRDLIVAVTPDLSSPEGGSVVLTSPDGIAWTAGGVPWKLHDIHGDDDGFVAAGDLVETVIEGGSNTIRQTPVIVRSDDGLAWEIVTSGVPDGGGLESITRDRSGRYVAAGVTRDGRVFTWASNGDGEPWTQSVLTEPEAVMTVLGFTQVRVVRQARGLVAAANTVGGPMVWISPDGVDWQMASAPSAIAETGFTALAIHGDTLIAFGATASELPYPSSRPYYLWSGVTE